MNKDMKDILKYHNERERFKYDFYKKRKYKDLIDIMLDKEIDSDDYSEPKLWTYQVDEMFSFLYSYAFKIEHFDNGEVFIKYKDKFISLFEMHGQGCFRRIKTIEREPERYVRFEDIITLHEDGEKPIRSEVLDVVNIALDAFEVATSGIKAGINVDIVRGYMRDNLR